MYAITSSSYRAIASSTDVLPGETVVDVLPATLLATLRGAEVRGQRDAALRGCDWTQSPDSPLTSTQKTAWGTYRQQLRDLPAQAGFPDAVNWPTAP